MSYLHFPTPRALNLINISRHNESKRKVKFVKSPQQNILINNTLFHAVKQMKRTVTSVPVVCSSNE